MILCQKLNTTWFKAGTLTKIGKPNEHLQVQKAKSDYLVSEELIIGSVETGGSQDTHARAFTHARTHTHTHKRARAHRHTHAGACAKLFYGAYFQRSGKLHCCINKSFGWLAV